ncbi:MAG: tRNA 2-thiouridine(34) synthase MnmA [Desulfobacterales bacterium]
MKKKTAIAISGGIDSLVAAYLLKEKGDEVFGIHFITGFESLPHDLSLNSQASYEKSIAEITGHVIEKISKVARQLDIHIEVLDCSKDFKAKVVDYFSQTYLAGKTPNPCLVCNPSIKFGTVFNFARKMGASSLATGHYAGSIIDNTGRYHLIKGVDTEKDQSYFLAFLSQEQLSHAVFPLSELTKKEVIKLAQKKGLNPFINKESQDICFVKDKNYVEFLNRERVIKSRPGVIVNKNGEILGSHKGIHNFTIGQRRGINCPASKPYYILGIDAGKHTVVAGSKEELLTSECHLININWVAEKYLSPVKIHTRIRHRSQEVSSLLFPGADNTATIRFDTPQSSVTPGQGAVFYLGNEILGGGFIDNA